MMTNTKITFREPGPHSPKTPDTVIWVGILGKKAYRLVRTVGSELVAESPDDNDLAWGWNSPDWEQVTGELRQDIIKAAAIQRLDDDQSLGSRRGVHVYQHLLPTTGAVKITRSNDSINFTFPDQPDFQLLTQMSVTIEFDDGDTSD